MSREFKRVLFRNTLTALKRGNLDEAAELLEQLKVEDPLSLETRGLELELLIRSRRLEEAKPLAEQLLELHPSSARVLYLAGRLAYSLKEYATAVRHLSESQSIFPHWRTSHLRGQSLTQMGKLDEAESILVPLAEERPWVKLDLAWLYERREEYPRALQEIEAYLEEYPDNEFAQDQRDRLRGLTLDSDELLDEVASLREHGAGVPDGILPQYIETLLKKGRGQEAREFLHGMEDQLAIHTTSRIGWSCYRLQAYDLAFRLFSISFPRNRGNVKFLTAFEKAADRCGRTGDLVSLYETHAEEDRRLFGRLRRLKRDE